MKTPIVPADAHHAMRYTKLDTDSLVTAVSAAGRLVLVRRSDDPGRFICNYVYYKSLAHTANKPNQVRFLCLDVMPAFSVIITITL